MVDARRQAAASRFDAHRVLAAIVESSDDAILGKTLDGTILTWNVAAERMYGYTPAEVVGRHVSMLVPADRPMEIPQILERIGRGERVDHYETIRMHRDGTRLNVSLTISPLKDASGRIVGASAIARDITERKRAEAQLARQAMIMRFLHAASLASNEAGTVEAAVLTLRSSWQALLGATSGALYKTGHVDLPLTYAVAWPEQDGPEAGWHQPLVARVCASRAPIWDEGGACAFPLLVGCAVEGVLVFPADGPPSADVFDAMAIAGSQLVRVIERERATHRVTRSEALLAEAQQLARLGAWDLDVATGEVVWSEEMFRIYGIGPDGGPPSLELARSKTHPDDLAAFDSAHAAAIGGRHAAVFDRRIVRPDGAVRHVRSRIDVLRDDKGRAIRMVGAVQDVTERFEFERMKDEFIALVSHELRTPLNTLTCALDLLHSEDMEQVSPTGRRMLSHALDNGARLSRLIHDILELQKADQERLAVRPRAVYVPAVVKRAARDVAPLAARHAIAVRTSACRSHVWADPERLLQVLTNLLGNALKFAPPDSLVRLEARLDGDRVRFRVRDEGPGIPADEREAVFERFHRLPSPDGRIVEGTGLGLAICRAIVEAHGGRIWANSGPGGDLNVMLARAADPD